MSYQTHPFAGRAAFQTLACLLLFAACIDSGFSSIETAEQKGRIELVLRIRVKVNRDEATRTAMPYIPTLARIPFGATENMSVMVDWGDGTPIETFNKTAPCAGAPDSRCLHHPFKTWGNYTIRITSLYNSSRDETAWNFGWADMNRTWKDEEDLVDLLEVAEWSIQQLVTLRYTFAGIRRSYASLMKIPSYLPPNVISIAGMFAQCAHCNNPNVSLWHVSNIIDLSHVFSGAHAFNQPLSGWRTGRSVDFSGLFLAASSFNQDISRWDISNARFLSHMFMSAFSFNQPIASWNTTSVVRMDSMFHLARTFNQPLRSWDTRRVQQMTGMFFGAENFNQDIGPWNVSSCVSMELMFQGASRFSRDLSRWDVRRILGTPRAFAAGATRFPSELWPRFFNPKTTEDIKTYYKKFGPGQSPTFTQQGTTPAGSPEAAMGGENGKTPTEIADEAWKILHDPAMTDLLAETPVLKQELERVYRLAYPAK